MTASQLNNLAVKHYGSTRWVTALAHDLGVTRQTVHRWKRGGIIPRHQVLHINRLLSEA